jgi:hypothetical protein
MFVYNGGRMKILHILNDGPSDSSAKIIETQSKEHEVKVVELSKKASYESLIDEIFSHDKVVSW